MDGRPDAVARLRIAAVRRPVRADRTEPNRADRTGRNVGGTLAGTRHVFDRHSHRKLEGLARAGVHDGDVATLPCPARPDSAQESGDRLDGALRRREPDALGRARGQPLQPFQADGQVGTALRARQGVDFVDDHVLDAAQDLGCLAGQDQVQGLGSGDQDVRRVADEVAPLLRGRVPGSDADFDLGDGQAGSLRGQADARQGRPQVPLDVVDQGLEGRHVQDADGSGVGPRPGRARFGGQPVQAPQERGQRLAASRGGVDQGVPARGDTSPAFRLGGSRPRKRRPEPLRRGRSERRKRIFRARAGG